MKLSLDTGVPFIASSIPLEVNLPEFTAAPKNPDAVDNGTSIPKFSSFLLK